MNLPKEELNCILITITAFLSVVALIALSYLYLRYKCGCCQPRQKGTGAGKELPQVQITFHNDKSPLADPEIDFIDSRNTNLVSSTYQVKSIHEPVSAETAN